MAYLNEVTRDEMPYERIQKYGVEVLSDAELLAVFIRTGTKKYNPVRIGQMILKKAGDNGLSGIINIGKQKLMEIDGIGEIKAIQLLALAEINKRISRQNAKRSIQMSNPSSVADYFMELLRHRTNEVVWVAAFDTKYTLISDIMISCGTSNASLVSPKEVYKYALSVSASAIIMLHNHPSGDPSPSNKDIEITRQMDEAGKILDITFADHIIIGDNRYFSMKENDYL